MKKKLIVIICVLFMLEISCTTIPELKLVPVDNTENTSQDEVTASNSTSSDRTLSDEEVVEAVIEPEAEPEPEAEIEPTSDALTSSEPIETDMAEIKEGLPESGPEFADSVETPEVASLEEEIPIKVLTSDRTLSDEEVVEAVIEPEPEPEIEIETPDLDPLASISEQDRENVETIELVLPNEKLREENNFNSTDISMEIPISDKSEVLLEDRNVTGNQQLEVVDSANEIKTSNDLEATSLDVKTEPIVSPIDPDEKEKLDVVDIQEVNIQESHNELPQIIELESIEEPVSRQLNQRSTLMIIFGGVIVSLLVLIILFLFYFRPDTFHRFKVKYFLLVSWTHRRIDSIKNIKANWEKRRSPKDFTKSELSTVDVKSDGSQEIQESKLKENGEDEHI